MKNSVSKIWLELKNMMHFTHKMCEALGIQVFWNVLYPLRTDEERILDVVPREDGARNSG